MPRPHMLRRLAVTAVASATALAGVVTQASAAGPSSPRTDAQRSHHATLKAGSNLVTAAADLTVAQVLAQVNADRARYGVPAAALDTANTAALNAHAHYVALNAGVDDDLSTEESFRSGYTAAGAEVAPYTSVQQSSTWQAALSGWLSDPFFRDVELLDQTTRTIGFGSDGNVRLYMVTSSGEAPTGYPRTYPAGWGNTELVNGAPWIAADYGCSGKGFPVSATFDYLTYGQATAVSGVLYADGSPVATCVMNPAGLTSGQAAIMPVEPLKPGTHYTGSITATLEVLAGGTKQVTQPIDFTTAAPATGIAGDQNGDGAADLFTVNNANELWFYKGSKTGAFGHGWKVGQGWGAFNWLALAGDVDKDGRSDLIGRTSDGKMYLYYSEGMGRLRAGGEVGHGWGGLSLLTVVGDMNNDGVRDLVGRTADGSLYRYNLGATITGGTRIGTGWNGMSSLIGLGSMNGDVYADVVAIRRDGTLYAYYAGPAGTIVSQAEVGHGWTGWTALFVPGDFNGDGQMDMTGRNPSNELHSYMRYGSRFSASVRAGSGFGSFRLFA